MTPTMLNLFFVSEMLKPEDPKGWKKLRQRRKTEARRASDPEKDREYQKRWRADNLEAMQRKDHDRYWADPKAARERSRAYREENPERVAAQNKEQYWRDPEKSRAECAAWVKDHPEQVRATHRRWLQENPDKVRAIELRRDKNKKRTRMRGYLKDRRANDPEFKLIMTLRSRINQALKNNTKGAKTRELIGCTIEELRAHLEKQFRPGMTWENHGTVWHVDHIRPCASFDFRDPAQKFECFNWSNTQPLFAAENLQKGDHYVPR